MIIYGEYLFLENFIVGALLIFLTGKLIGNTPPIWKIALSASICGLSGFIIFLPIEGVISAVLRIAIGVIVSFASFGRNRILKNSAIFLILTFLSGGVVIALLLWQKQPAITHQGIIYMDAVTYLKLICFGILAFGFTYWFIKLIRRRTEDIAMRGKVKIVIGDKNYDFEGYVDSGNSLRDPITGKPAVLLDKKGASKLPFMVSDFKERYMVIPYKAVGVDCGYLEGIRSDEIIFDKKCVIGAPIAFYDGIFEGFDVLINKDFLEKEL